MDKSSRTLFLYTQLSQGRIVRKKELAQQFGVDEKSIQRDLETIRNFLDEQAVEHGYGSRLVYDTREKGYRLEERGRPGMSDAEVLAVSKILLESRAFSKDQMMGLLDKIADGCVPQENRKVIDDLLRNERFHYMELRHHRPFMDKLMPLARAIRECRVIKISYEKLKGDTTVERRVEPLAILFSEFYFYLVGFIEGIDKEAAFENPEDPFPTIYRIDRIKELDILISFPI